MRFINSIFLSLLISAVTFAGDLPFSSLISEGLENERKVALQIQDNTDINDEFKKYGRSKAVVSDNKKDFKIKLKKISSATKKKKKSVQTSSSQKQTKVTDN